MSDLLSRPLAVSGSDHPPVGQKMPVEKRQMRTHEVVIRPTAAGASDVQGMDATVRGLMRMGCGYRPDCR